MLPRRDSFQGQAAAQALRAEVGDPLGLLDLPFALFRWVGSVRQIENTATGLHDGLEIIVADYWFAPTGANEYDDYERYMCVLTATPSEWSDLTVVPERFGSRLRNAAGFAQIDTESEAFNRTFDVRSADQRFASAFVDARMMQWLLDQPAGTGFEVLGGRLMVFRPRAISSLDDLARAVQLHDAFMAHVPRVVPIFWSPSPPSPSSATRSPLRPSVDVTAEEPTVSDTEADEMEEHLRGPGYLE